MNPLERVVFISKLLNFVPNSVTRVHELSLVSSEWRDTITNHAESKWEALKPFTFITSNGIVSNMTTSLSTIVYPDANGNFSGMEIRKFDTARFMCSIFFGRIRDARRLLNTRPILIDLEPLNNYMERNLKSSFLRSIILRFFNPDDRSMYERNRFGDIVGRDEEIKLLAHMISHCEVNDRFFRQLLHILMRELDFIEPSNRILHRVLMSIIRDRDIDVMRYFKQKRLRSLEENYEVFLSNRFAVGSVASCIDFLVKAGYERREIARVYSNSLMVFPTEEEKLSYLETYDQGVVAWFSSKLYSDGFRRRTFICDECS